MKQLLLALLAITLFVAACKKTADPPKTQDTEMRSGKWRISSSMVTLKQFNGVPFTLDYGKYRKKCIVDNYLQFDSLNRGAIHNGGISCQVSDPDSIGFIWVLKNNGLNIDLLNCYTLVDSVQQNITVNSAGVYVAAYDTAISYVSNLYNAQISNFTQSSFVLKYDLPAHYFDTTMAKGGSQTAPVLLLDTFHFAITYTNF